MTAKETVLHISAVFKERLCVYQIMCCCSRPTGPSVTLELLACDKWFLIDNLDTGFL